MTVNLNIPTTWNALSFKQIQNICHTLHCNRIAIANTTDPHAQNEINTVAYFKICKELLRENGFFKVRIALRQLRVKAYQELSNFIFHGNNLHKFTEKLKHKRQVFYGPQFRLKNVTIGEFSFADALFYKWSQTNEPIYLDVLCATLYRPKTKTPTLLDHRVPFTKMLAENNTEIFQKMPLIKKLAIAYAFEGSRNYLVDQHPHIFPKRKTATNPTAKPPKYVPFGKLISAKIQYDPSKLETVENMLAYKFFSVYENELIHIKTLEKQKR